MGRSVKIIKRNIFFVCVMEAFKGTCRIIFKEITYCIFIELHLIEGMDVSFVLLLAVRDSVDEELLGV